MLMRSDPELTSSLPWFRENIRGTCREGLPALITLTWRESPTHPLLFSCGYITPGKGWGSLRDREISSKRLILIYSFLSPSGRVWRLGTKNKELEGAYSREKLGTCSRSVWGCLKRDTLLEILESVLSENFSGSESHLWVKVGRGWRIPEVGPDPPRIE